MFFSHCFASPCLKTLSCDENENYCLFWCACVCMCDREDLSTPGEEIQLARSMRHASLLVRMLNMVSTYSYG